MSEQLATEIVNFFKDKIPNELIIFVVSLFPVLELRGGLIAAKLLNVELVRAFIICYIGNMLPIPFILLFIRKIFNFLKTKKRFAKLIEKLEIRSMRKSESVKKYRVFGLLLFVAIPFPGTGGWTGALIAALMDMRIKRSLPVIFLGVFIAGLIMSTIMYGFFGLFI